MKKNSFWGFITETALLLIVAYILAILFQTFLYQPFKVEQGSMTPTLIEGERIFVSKISYIFGKPKRKDIVTLLSPKEPPMPTLKYGIFPVMEKRTLVKRIIGLPGDTVVIKAGKTYINGKAIDEPYIKLPDPADYGPYEVPKNNYFAMGDNRAGSRDSRDPSIGFIPAKNILGKAVVVYWPINDVRLL